MRQNIIIKLCVVLPLWVCFVAFSQVKQGLKIPKNPKIGLSLAGGGAKGFAHIGVLKVIDSLGIKIDYIAGTSMGSIVGGLYASGYKAKDIEKIVMDTDFYTIIANEKNRQESSFFKKSNDKYLLNIPIVNGKINVLPKAISAGQKNIYMLKDLFKNVSTTDDFSKLPIPFMCIGTNLESGKMEIFEKGDLVSSIMASSAFPGLMDPVKIGDSLYIDGAMTVNYPSKPLKDKGIDIVIGVDLNQPLATRKELTSAIAILNQVIDYSVKKETQRQLEYTDINIKPDLQGYSATSYGDKAVLLKAGYTEAQKYIPILKQLPKTDKTLLRMPINTVYSNAYKIDSVSVTQNMVFNKNYIVGKMGLSVPSIQTYRNINTMVEKLYATDNFTLINYDIVPNENANTLKLDVTEDKTRYFLKFGLHYDDIFKTGLLLNATIKRLFFNNSTLSLDVVFGDTARFYFNYFMDNGYIPGFGLASHGTSLTLKNDKGLVQENWRWLRNEAFIQSVWKDKYAIGGGIRHEYFEVKQYGGTAKNFFQPYVFIKSDTQNDKDFPTRGIYLDSEGQLFNLDKDNDEQFAQAKITFQANMPISKSVAYQLNLFGGISIGNEIPAYFYYHPGGIFMQKVANFTPFSGIHFGSVATRNAIIASNSLQVQFIKNFFATAHASFMNRFDTFDADKVIRLRDISAGISVGYKSPLGPIKLNYSKVFNKKDNGIFTVILGYWF